MRTQIKGETLDEAINNAMIELSITSENLKYDIIQQGTTGFLGIGSKPYIIEAYDKNDKEEIYKEKQKEQKLEKDEKGIYVFKKENSERSNFLKENKEEIYKKAKEFLEPIFKGFEEEIALNYTINEETSSMIINLQGEKMGVIIGKYGQTLDSLQHILNIVVNENLKEKIKIRLDSENYRDKRYKKIEAFAKSIVQKVKKTKRDYSLEPMSSYDRRIIHSLLQKERNIETVSKGEGRERHVVVKYRKN